MPRKDKRKKRYLTQEDIERNKQLAAEREEQEKQAAEKKAAEKEAGEKKKTGVYAGLDDEQHRIDYLYGQNKDKNRRNFRNSFHYSVDGFIRIAQENGWNHEPSGVSKKVIGDKRALEYLYRTAMDSGDPKLLEICQKIVKTPLDTAEKRYDFVSGIKDEARAVLETNKTLSYFAKAELDDFANRTLSFFSEAEFEPVREKTEEVRRRKEEARKAEEARKKAEAELEAERKSYNEQMKKNGWGANSGLAARIFREYHEKIAVMKVPQEFKDAMKAQYDKIKNTPLDKDTPRTHQDQLLKEYIDTYKKFAPGTSLKYDVNDFERLTGNFNKTFFKRELEKEREFLFQRAKKSFAEGAGIEEGPENNPSRKYVNTLLEKDEDQREIDKVRKNPEARQKALDEFPFTQEDYEKANLKQRTEKLKEYYVILVSDRMPAEKAKKAANDPLADQLFTRIASDAKRLDTCKEAMNSELFEEAVIGPFPRRTKPEQRELSRQNFIDYHLNDALNNEKMYFFRQEQAAKKAEEERRAEERRKAIEAENKRKERARENRVRIREWNKAKVTEAKTDKKNITGVEKTAARLKSKVDQVDFNMFGLGSSEFRMMKNAVHDLARFSTERYGGPDSVVSLADDAALLSKQEKTIQAIKRYLARKEQDFAEDPNRKDSKKRQKREQKRIFAAVDMLKDLEADYARNLERVNKKVENIRENLRINLEEAALKMEDPQLSNPEYLNQLALVTDMVNKYNGMKWKCTDHEKMAEFLAQRQDEAKAAYEAGDAKKMIDKEMTSGRMEALREGYRHIYGIEGDPNPIKPDGQRLTLQDVFRIQKDTTAGYKTEIQLPVSKSVGEIVSEADTFGKNLFSVQTKIKTNREDLFTNDEFIGIRNYVSHSKSMNDFEPDFEMYNRAYERANALRRAEKVKNIEEGFRTEKVTVKKPTADYSGNLDVKGKLDADGKGKAAPEGQKGKKTSVDDTNVIDRKTQARKPGGRVMK